MSYNKNYKPIEFLSYGKQQIDEDDISAVVETLRSDFLTQGPKVEEFEKALCDYTGAKYAVAFANGTATLHCAVASLNIEQNAEAITSPNTFVASSNCMAYNGIRPVFADIDPKTYNINPKEILKKISDKTRLIIPVHFAGQPCDMEQINQIAKKHSLFVIEDAAHAIGSRYADGTMVGNCRYSDMTSFSFHPVKTMTTGEGGAVTTNSRELYEKLKLFRSHGITRDPALLQQNHGVWYYEMQELGYNYRITDIQAALGVTQLKKLDNFVKRRREIVRRYNEAFADLKLVTIPYEQTGVVSAFHLYVLMIDFDRLGVTRNELMLHLKGKNIGTQVHYIPVLTQPYYQRTSGYKQGDYPIAEDYYKKALSIPLYPKMTDDDVEYVIRSIIETVK